MPHVTVTQEPNGTETTGSFPCLQLQDYHRQTPPEPRIILPNACTRSCHKRIYIVSETRAKHDTKQYGLSTSPRALPALRGSLISMGTDAKGQSPPRLSSTVEEYIYENKSTRITLWNGVYALKQSSSAIPGGGRGAGYFDRNTRGYGPFSNDMASMPKVKLGLLLDDGIVHSSLPVQAIDVVEITFQIYTREVWRTSCALSFRGLVQNAFDTEKYLTKITAHKKQFE
ncbi:uncharacterized protein BDR25DRAFT_362780 [Lindgomyces ingoldianus]|uniref:Uncharacterized protein n=1 Tax=Lindgomyces ingoldianus TaxID=673940 RepID=A0ACB6QBA0_9PLEO|nr:uncharacterized protein BDR25DRAFT_362780 [Lindgomyces ingoldianus]KAF2463431.1 hypothetical protein BDR25DRAFT_362780 [Lindgomyces ingoldianus]